MCARKSVVDRRAGAVERGAVPEEQVVAVGLVEECVDLEGELTGVGVLRQCPALGREQVGFDQLVPAGNYRAYAISDPSRRVSNSAAVEEEAAAGEDAALDVGQEAFAELREAFQALGSCMAGSTTSAA